MDGTRKLVYLVDGIRKIVHSLADFGKRSTGGHGNYLLWQICNGYFEIIGTEIGSNTP